jgi:predicted Zn-dependent peptidase
VQDGLGVFVYPTDRFKTITMHAVFVQDLEEETAARSALVPFVLRRGTRRWPTYTAMQRTLEDLYGAGFRADVGKLGDKQLLSFHVEVPDGRFLPGHPDMLAAGVDFLRTVIQDPHLTDGRFPGPVVDQEREILRRQMLALINDKGQYAVTRLLETMAGGRPFGLRRYGRLEDLAGVDPDTLTTWWRDIIDRRMLWIFVVGAVDADLTDRMMRQAWGARRVTPVTPPPAFVSLHRERLVVEEEDVQQGKLNLGYATGRRLGDADFPALMMYAGILGGYPHSKLFVNVREKASLAYYAFARLEGTLGLMIVGAGIEFRDRDAALAIIRRQVEDMALGRITPDEMAFTLEAFRNDLRSEEDAPGALIARQLERELLGAGVYGEDLVAALERVTVADVMRVAEPVTLDTIYFLTRKGDTADDASH